MKELAKKVQAASKKLRRSTEDERVQVLHKLAKLLSENTSKIIEANKTDLENAEKNNLNDALKDRLLLNEKRIQDMIQGVQSIAKQPPVLGLKFDEKTNANGLQIAKQRIPLGVILMIFESRPNVVIDCAALAIKSGNAIILKGGKEALHSNTILGDIVKAALKGTFPEESVETLASDDRSAVQGLLSCHEEIDVVIPRGGESLIRSVHDNASMPVIAHFKGLCHIYVDASANLEKALNVIVNAKTQRTGVCNAVETVLVHESCLDDLLPPLTEALLAKGTELRVDSQILDLEISSSLALAKDEDWATEYLSNILAIKTVKDLDEALDHIDRYGSFHTEAVLAEDPQVIARFQNGVDAGCVVVNASTRFNDGGQLGLGAEIGISTTKIHAYGPMGAEQLTATRYLVQGDGQIRE